MHTKHTHTYTKGLPRMNQCSLSLSIAQQLSPLGLNTHDLKNQALFQLISSFWIPKMSCHSSLSLSLLISQQLYLSIHMISETRALFQLISGSCGHTQDTLCESKGSPNWYLYMVQRLMRQYIDMLKPRVMGKLTIDVWWLGRECTHVVYGLFCHSLRMFFYYTYLYFFVFSGKKKF